MLYDVPLGPVIAITNVFMFSKFKAGSVVKVNTTEVTPPGIVILPVLPLKVKLAAEDSV
jgi:hypothetical protein